MITPASSSSMVNAQLAGAIRDVAAAVNNAGSGQTTSQVLKGVVQAVNMTASPPSIDLNLNGDASTLVSGIVFMDSYTPFVGDVVWCLEQNNTIFAVGQPAAGGTDAANGWISSSTPTAITLSSGTTSGANGGGPIEARLKMESGSLKVEMRGIAGWTGSTVIFTLPVGYRPSVRRPLVAACAGTGQVMVQASVETNGTVIIYVNGNTGSASPGTNSQSESVSVSVSVGGAGVSASGGTSTDGTPAHSHSVSVSGSSGGASGSGSGGTSGHSHTVNSHSHTISTGNPSWISFDGLEFYL